MIANIGTVVTSIAKNPSAQKVVSAAGKAAITGAKYAATTAVAYIGVNVGLAAGGATLKGIDKLRQKMAERKTRKIDEAEQLLEELQKELREQAQDQTNAEQATPEQVNTETVEAQTTYSRKRLFGGLVTILRRQKQ